MGDKFLRDWNKILICFVFVNQRNDEPVAKMIFLGFNFYF